MNPDNLPARASSKQQFRKSVVVVNSRANGPLTLVQRKIMNSWLLHAVKTPPDSTGWWTISVAETCEDIGFDSKNTQHLKQAADEIGQLKFDWDVFGDEKRDYIYKKSSLFPEIEIFNRSNTLYFRFQISSEVREKVLDPQIFSIIDMHIVRNFRRAYALAIWEHCIRSTKFGTTKPLDWKNFRDAILGVSSDSKSYQQYKFFKSRILKECIEEINTVSEHSIDLVEIKKGRSVEKIYFSVKRRDGKDESQETSLPEGATIMLGRMINFGIPQAEAKQLLSNYGEDSIGAAIEYTSKRINKARLPKLESAAAYFKGALQKGYAAVIEESEKQHPSKSAAKKEEKKASLDLPTLFARHRRNSAKVIFDEIDQAEKEALIERYNCQQDKTTLKWGKRKNRAVELAFLDWMALDMWGVAAPDEILAFGSEVIAGKHQDLLQ